MKSILDKTLLWFSDLARIVFQPGDPTLRMVISRNRKFEEVLPLLLATLALAHGIGLGWSSMEMMFRNLLLSVLLVPAVLIVFSWALKLVIRNPENSPRYQEVFFHLSALAVSAGFLAVSLLAFLPVLPGILLTVPIFLYLFLRIMVRGIQLTLDISFGRALAVNLVGCVLAVPLFFLCAGFFALVPSATGMFYR